VVVRAEVVEENRAVHFGWGGMAVLGKLESGGGDTKERAGQDERRSHPLASAESDGAVQSRQTGNNRRR
jgi:hypothetical protein